MILEKPKKRALIVHRDLDSHRPLVSALESAGWSVTLAPDTPAGLSQPRIHRFNIFIIGDGLKTMSTAEFIRLLGEQPLAFMIPVIVMSGEALSGENLLKWTETGVDVVFPESAKPGEIAAAADKLITGRASYRLDPVTNLISGPILDRHLEHLCTDNPDSWYFIEIKLLGLKAFNLQYGYDAGDNLLFELGNLIEETVSEMGAETDVTGRLYETRFCAATRTRRIDSLCRSLTTKSDRILRKHYTPFEWMKGYMTIENGKLAGNYHLCEIIAAAVQVPAKWDNNRAYMLDLADDILKQLKKSEQNYAIVTP
jgi:GGDEF domain-containing protein